MKPSPLEQLLSALQGMAFRRIDAEHFAPLFPIPLWCEPLVTATVSANAFHLGRRSHFLQHFLGEAEHFWAAGHDGNLPSGLWMETAISESPLSAVALARGSDRFLLISRVDDEYARQFGIMNQARTAMIEREALAREIEKKEVLVHCIVHDLANPLAGMSGLLDILQTQTLSPGVTRMVEMANDAARRQKLLIQQILDVFSAEASSLEQLHIAPGTAPDLIVVAEHALQHLFISARRQSVTTRLVVDPALGATFPIMAETTRLERIFANLLENALRHTPAHSEIVVTLTRQGDLAEVAITDSGRGVPESATAHLFKKLAPSAGGIRGKAGLGLYFCRITVERWGGTIGYRPGANGGACFWFQLQPYAEPAAG